MTEKGADGEESEGVGGGLGRDREEDHVDPCGVCEASAPFWVVEMAW